MTKCWQCGREKDENGCKFCGMGLKLSFDEVASGKVKLGVDAFPKIRGEDTIAFFKRIRV